MYTYTRTHSPDDQQMSGCRMLQDEVLQHSEEQMAFSLEGVVSVHNVKPQTHKQNITHTCVCLCVCVCVCVCVYACVCVYMYTYSTLISVEVEGHLA